MMTYTIAVSINIYRGNMSISCGCGGVLESEKLTFFIIYRNFLLIILGLSLIPVEINVNRAASSVWDGIIFPLVISICVLLTYGVVNQFNEQRL
jgi:hypothetical protein